jgi:hypothetical protein
MDAVFDSEGALVADILRAQDAPLVAAAPDLFAAIEALLDGHSEPYSERTPDLAKAMANARDAVARAKVSPRAIVDRRPRSR